VTSSRTFGSRKFVCWRNGKATLSKIDNALNKAPSWNMTPMSRRSLRI